MIQDANEMNSYQLLIKKLDEFIRKYYKNLLVRGLILFVALFGLFYLVTALAEYFGRFNTLTRTIIFYSYLALNVLILWRLILIPLGKLLRLGKVISHFQAAQIIGKHFPEVSDKLLNTLELKKIEEENNFQSDLIRASIDQRIERLKPVPFRAAIDIRSNLKYLRYALPPVLVVILLIIAAPSVITGPTERIVKHNTFFEEPLPFYLTIQNNRLEALQQDDYTLLVEAEGDALPNEVYIETGKNMFKLKKKSASKFSYTYRNMQEDSKFYLVADKYRSPQYTIKVLPKPIVLNFEIDADYPEYTGKNDEIIENTGDIVVPEGTTVTWKFYTRDTREITMYLGEEMTELENQGSNVFSLKKRIRKSMVYSVISSNEFVRSNDSLGYSISVITDAYPSISVEQVKDSVFDKRIFFMGDIKDDYGFSKLTFNYTVIPEGKEYAEMKEEEKVPVPVSLALAQQQFFHMLDIDSILIEPGEQVTYYFEVFDNDGVNGPKSTRSQNLFFKVPTMDEIDQKTEEASENIKDIMDESIRDAKDLQKKIDELNRKLLEKESIGWQEKQQIQELLDEYKEIQKQVEELQKENEIKSLRENQYNKMNEELARKQQELEKLMEEVLTDEMKEMLEELQKMMEEIDKEKVNEMLEEMKMDSEELEKELDRNLELFKQLEFEKKFQETIDKLNELQEKQDKLSEETKEGKDEESSKEEQEKLNAEFEKLREELDELDMMNKELEEPNTFETTDEQEEAIQEDMQESLDQLNQGKSKKASGSQKGASDKMKQLSESLTSMQNMMYQENLGEDIEDLREILENLLELSFEQEEIISETGDISTMDPQYVKLIEEQKTLKDDMAMVEDSLWALSKRQQMIEPFVTRELQQIDDQLEKAIENLNDRRKGDAGGNQQYVMTSINNLALMLSETLKQMEQSLQMQSSGQCKNGNPKPGQGKPSMKSMRQMQQQLSKQLQQMKENMGKQRGQSNKRDPRQSEQFARMAAQQEAIRRMMEQYREDLKEQGYKPGKELQEIMEAMEQNEAELVNKLITEQMMERLNQIETRLLKHEKAELKREMEEKRESKTPKSTLYGNPEDFLEYNKLKLREEEMLKSIPPSLKPFYKDKVNRYFYNFEVTKP
jgi:hypothetical protein